MSNDINGTVVGIQGVAVSATSPSDGYVLTYDGVDGYWQPKAVSAAGGLNNSVSFTSSASWTCPAGVFGVMVIGAGGGGGGSGGANTTNVITSGGSASWQSMTYCIVSPGSTYTITIGVGGAGGGGNSSGGAGANGVDGGDTLFGSLTCFTGAGGGRADGVSGLPIKGSIGNAGQTCPAQGGYGAFGAGGQNGLLNFVGGFAGGSGGSGIGYYGGSGGGAGAKGNGANGGNANPFGSGSDGIVAGANTGAGGGSGGAGSSNGGNGGTGGSGYLTIVW